MPRDRMYVRRFLNEPGHHGGAYVLLSVSDTEDESGSYAESNVRFELADCVRNVQLEFPLHDAAARRNSLRKARLLSQALRTFEQALAAEAEVAAQRERDRSALRSRPSHATEWMVQVMAEVTGLDPDTAPDALAEHLESASASVGLANGCLSVTLTVEASCAADAVRIGELMLRAALTACGLDAPSNVRAELDFVER